MLEHFEVIELEEKWRQIDKQRKRFKILDFINIKFDRTILILFLLISVSLGIIAWLLFSGNSKDDILSNMEQNISILPQEFNTSSNVEENVIYEDIQVATNSTVDNNTRGGLSFNDIGIDVSVDSGGFTISNNYVPVQQVEEKRESFSTIPKDEIIDFGNPPSPPKNISSSSVNAPKRAASNQNKDRIKIQTTTLKASKQDLESKFYSTNNIMYSLELSEQAYNKKNYDDAIKWALVSNDIDKNNVKSWILFAKANYKKGNKEDALIALENFNARRQNPEVKIVIDQIKAGSL